jgi:3-oxoacyl-[acyl-carrier-protein] synthase-3
MKVGIDAISYALPEAVLTNAELGENYPHWNMDRLAERTGVQSRHIAGDGETALDLTMRACQALTSTGDLEKGEIDAVIFCTETPDYPLPPNACLLHGRLGLGTEVAAFDINLACSGYIYGLELARSLIVSGSARKVLLATGDTYTRLIHPEDRATRCLFGDGAAVSLISAAQDSSGFIDIKLGTSGQNHERFIVRAGGARMPRGAETRQEVSDRSGNIRSAENIEMDGLGVLSFFNSTVPPHVLDTLSRNGLSVPDVDLFVFHQASKVALDSLQRQLKIADENMLVALSEVGNLVSASIPVAFQQAIEGGRVSSGNLIAFCGFGVGLSWGTALLRMK